MRTLPTPCGRLLVIPGLPEDAKCFVGGGDTPFCANPDGEYLNCRFGGSGLNIALPPGSWSLLSKASELTEEQMELVCEPVLIKWGSGSYFGYKDYVLESEEYQFEKHPFESVGSSYQSFLTFHGIKENDILLIENKAQ